MSDAVISSESMPSSRRSDGPKCALRLRHREAHQRQQQDQEEELHGMSRMDGEIGDVQHEQQRVDAAQQEERPREPSRTPPGPSADRERDHDTGDDARCRDQGVDGERQRSRSGRQPQVDGDDGDGDGDEEHSRGEPPTVRGGVSHAGTMMAVRGPGLHHPVVGTEVPRGLARNPPIAPPFGTPFGRQAGGQAPAYMATTRRSSCAEAGGRRCGPSAGLHVVFSRSGRDPYCVQSKVRVTAFFHSAYSAEISSADMVGVHSLSLPQFARRSS